MVREERKRAMSRRRKLGFAVVAVALVLGLAEAALWAAGVPPLVDASDPYAGFSTRLRVFREDAARGVYETDPRAAERSFNRQEFRAVKPANGYRLFVLGGSAAAGFPWGAQVAFARVLGTALQAGAPGRTVE